MDDYKERLVVVRVTATHNHCSNDCRGISDGADYCNLFKKPLTWDKRKKHNGNRRLTVCKKAERDTPL